MRLEFLWEKCLYSVITTFASVESINRGLCLTVSIVETIRNKSLRLFTFHIVKLVVGYRHSPTWVNHLILMCLDKL